MASAGEDPDELTIYDNSLYDTSGITKVQDHNKTSEDVGMNTNSLYDTNQNVYATVTPKKEKYNHESGAGGASDVEMKTNSLYDTNQVVYATVTPKKGKYDDEELTIYDNSLYEIAKRDDTYEHEKGNVSSSNDTTPCLSRKWKVVLIVAILVVVAVIIIVVCLLVVNKPDTGTVYCIKQHLCNGM